MYDAYKADPKNNEAPNEARLRKRLNVVKREQFPWMLEVTKCAPQQALRNLGTAFTRFFKGQGGYPKKHKKNHGDSFYLDNTQFEVRQGIRKVGEKDGLKEGEKRIIHPAVHVPNLGWVRLRESLGVTGKIISATVSRKADRWFVSVTMQDHRQMLPLYRKNQTAVGVDLGLTHLATLSTGEKVAGSKALAALLPRIKRLSRSLSRKKKLSKNRKKAKFKLAKLHARVANVRKDGMHKLTTRLATEFHTVVIEDLNVKGLLRNKRLARHISDAAWGELRRQLTYKCERYGAGLVVADRFFASSKLCNLCGEKNKTLTLGTRRWTCVCGAVHDRDENAAINLRNLAVSSTV